MLHGAGELPPQMRNPRTLLCKGICRAFTAMSSPSAEPEEMDQIAPPSRERGLGFREKRKHDESEKNDGRENEAEWSHAWSPRLQVTPPLARHGSVKSMRHLILSEPCSEPSPES
jgi:hypothetical protein